MLGTALLSSCATSPSARSAPKSVPSQASIEVSRCEPAGTDKHFGSWQPSADEVLTATDALPEICLPKSGRRSAVAACQTKVKQALVSVAIPIKSDEGPAECSETFAPAEWNQRHFIVARAFYQYGAKFSGTVVTAELTKRSALHVIENRGLTESCKTPPTRAPADWTSMPPDLQAFICGWQ